MAVKRKDLMQFLADEYSSAVMRSDAGNLYDIWRTAMKIERKPVKKRAAPKPKPKPVPVPLHELLSSLEKSGPERAALFFHAPFETKPSRAQKRKLHQRLYG